MQGYCQIFVNLVYSQIGECFAGTFINASNECEACPKGSYSDQDYQSECTNCTAGFTTLSTGSDSAALCLCKYSEKSCIVGVKMNLFYEFRHR